MNQDVEGKINILSPEFLFLYSGILNNNKPGIAEMLRRKTRKLTETEMIESAIENSLRPGDYIEDDFSWSFVSDLEKVKDIIENVVNKEPVRAIDLIETFIAACYEKAEEIDDSSGSFGEFVEELFCSWVNARQKADFEAKETVDRLLVWMDNDDYGFTYHLERKVSRFLNKKGLREYAAAIRTRYDAEGAKDHHRRQWGGTLKSIYAAGRDFKSYISICDETELLPVDCEILAGMLLSRRKPAEALKWVEKGLEIQSSAQVYRGSSYKLDTMKRDILTKLGRPEEALADAWQDFSKRPDEFTYEELLKHILKEQRTEYHNRILEVISRAELKPAIRLLLKLSEKNVLAERLRKISVGSLEPLSHYTTEPAAKILAEEYPDVAAKLYQAMGLRIVNAKKSKYYDAAISNFEQAKHCYEKADLESAWVELVENVRNNHSRKYSFMPGFEQVVEGKGLSTKPSFIELAKKRAKKIGGSSY
ncbi:MAG: hypothetical protein HN342_15095 [Nitrospina sp.]|nr:hypothetical protein [Nitrospina sp.]